MKTLYIVRHAKAGDHSVSHDFERVLTEGGKSDAAEMGKQLAMRNVKPDLVLASPAARTMGTAIVIAQEIQRPTPNIADDRRIYNAEADKLLKVIREQSDDVTSLMLVGHNPGITEFTNSIFGTIFTSLPTAGITGGQLNVNSWKDVRWGCGREEFFIAPK